MALPTRNPERGLNECNHLIVEPPQEPLQFDTRLRARLDHPDPGLRQEIRQQPQVVHDVPKREVEPPHLKLLRDRPRRTLLDRGVRVLNRSGITVPLYLPSRSTPVKRDFIVDGKVREKRLWRGILMGVIIVIRWEHHKRRLYACVGRLVLYSTVLC